MVTCSYCPKEFNTGQVCLKCSSLFCSEPEIKQLLQKIVDLKDVTLI